MSVVMGCRSSDAMASIHSIALLGSRRSWWSKNRRTLPAMRYLYTSCLQGFQINLHCSRYKIVHFHPACLEIKGIDEHLTDLDSLAMKRKSMSGLHGYSESECSSASRIRFGGAELSIESVNTSLARNTCASSFCRRMAESFGITSSFQNESASMHFFTIPSASMGPAVIYTNQARQASRSTR